MIKTIRKLTSAFCASLALLCALAMVQPWEVESTVAQTQSTAQMVQDPTDSTSVLAEAGPEWRYTRFGWQNANEWTIEGQIEHPPDRRFDNLHPVVLAMLFLMSVLVSIFWASNEWELAQLVGERDQS